MPFEDAAEDFTVLISYAHSDNEGLDPSNRWLDRLLEKLQSLVSQGKVKIWSDTQIDIEPWPEAFLRQLQNAKVLVLLVSPDFLVSKYIRNSELPVLWMHAKNKGAEVLPIILRPSLFTETKFKYPSPERGPQEFSLSVFNSFNPPNVPLNVMREDEQETMLSLVAEWILKLAQPTVVLKSAPDSPPSSTGVDQQSDKSAHLVTGSSLADALIVWDPEVVDHTDYVTLITALGDLVRSQGGIGVERIGHLGMGIPVSEDLLV